MEEELDLRELVRPLRRRRWLILGLILAAGLAGYAASRLATPVYETSTKILVVPKEDTGKFFLIDKEGAGLSIINQLGASPQIQTANYAEILKSRSLLLAVAEELGLGGIGFGLAVQSVPGTGIIEIRVQDRDPRRAQRIAETIVKCFRARLLRENQEEARQAREFFEEQLKVVGDRLNRLEAGLAKAPNQAELTRLKEEKASTEALYTLLLTKKSEMEIAEHMPLTDVRLVDPAYLPPKDAPIKPRTGLNVAVGLFIGLFLGVALAYLLEYLEAPGKAANEPGEAPDRPALG